MADLEQDLSLERPDPMTFADNGQSSSGQVVSPDGSSLQPADAMTPPPAVPPPDEGPSFLRRIVGRLNIFILLFVLLLVVAAGILVLTFKGGSPKTPTSKTSSLTDAQISSLKGATTIVGTSKQTLDVQSDSIFEGPILARSNLDIAGNITVGGALNLHTLNVSDKTTLNSLQLGNNLNVAGAVDVQGQLTLHKGLNVAGTASFGNVSANVLSATSLQLNGDLATNHHIVTGGGNLSKTAGTALGRGGTATLNGNDTAGTININTGSSPTAGLFISVKFVHAFSGTPHVIITPVGSAAGSISYYVNRDTSGFSVGTSSPPPAGKSFAFDYFVVQ